MWALAAAVCFFTFGVHTFAGQRFVVGPLAQVDPFARATVLVVWHMVTWTLLLCAGALLLRDREMTWLVAALCAGYAGVFLFIAQRQFHEAIRLPQWILLGTIAVLALAWHPAVVLLGAVAAVHLLWAFGVTWPAKDAKSLALAIIGRDVLPSRAACVAVVAALLGMVWALQAGPAWARYPIAAIFVLRGTFGFIEPLFRREITGTPYLQYSRFMYTPLSLAIGVAVLLAE